MIKKQIDRTAVMPLGNHTALGYLQESERFKEIPYLKLNDGKAPPWIIAVGDRRRVWKSIPLLKLRDAVLIDDEARKRFGEDESGRVALVVGIIEREGFRMPICVIETQMGCSGTQINLKELTYYSNETGYKLWGKKIQSDGIYIVRAGTCAGVNSRNKSEFQVNIGDLFIATETYGTVGALIQSIIGKIHFVGDVKEHMQQFMEIMRQHQILDLGYLGENLRTTCSPRLVLQLQHAADRRGLKNYAGPNFSKESLYAELGEDGFAALRDSYGVISTEMEQMVVDALAGEFRKAGISVHSGLISAAIGAIPGKSFPVTVEDKRLAKEAEQNALIVAADTLFNIAKGLNS